VTNKVPVTDQSGAMRQKAIDTLTKNHKPTTEANIKYIMDQLAKGAQ